MTWKSEKYDTDQSENKPPSLFDTETILKEYFKCKKKINQNLHYVYIKKKNSLYLKNNNNKRFGGSYMLQSSRQFYCIRYGVSVA